MIIDGKDRVGMHIAFLAFVEKQGTALNRFSSGHKVIAIRCLQTCQVSRSDL